jgi:YD repeat-containing protein
VARGQYVAGETDALNNTKTFAYDSVGNLSQYTDADGRANTYQYDSAGNVSGNASSATQRNCRVGRV